MFPKTDDYKTITSVDVTIFRPSVKKYDRDLITHILFIDNCFKNGFEQVRGTTYKRISSRNLVLIDIQKPKIISEQERITTIFILYGFRVGRLRKPIEKAQKIKQELIEELLTRRFRLI